MRYKVTNIRDEGIPGCAPKPLLTPLKTFTNKFLGSPSSCSGHLAFLAMVRVVDWVQMPLRTTLPPTPACEQAGIGGLPGIGGIPGMGGFHERRSFTAAAAEIVALVTLAGARLGSLAVHLGMVAGASPQECSTEGLGLWVHQCVGHPSGGVASRGRRALTWASPGGNSSILRSVGWPARRAPVWWWPVLMRGAAAGVRCVPKRNHTKAQETPQDLRATVGTLAASRVATGWQQLGDGNSVNNNNKQQQTNDDKNNNNHNNDQQQQQPHQRQQNIKGNNKHKQQRQQQPQQTHTQPKKQQTPTHRTNNYKQQHTT